MSTVPWIERTFNFDFSAELYPNILGRFRGAAARLEDATRGLSRERLTRSAAKWSIQENTGHLLDEEDLFRKRLEEYLAGAQVLSPAPHLHRELTHNDRNIKSVLQNFRAAREQQVQRLASRFHDCSDCHHALWFEASFLSASAAILQEVWNWQSPETLIEVCGNR